MTPDGLAAGGLFVDCTTRRTTLGGLGPPSEDAVYPLRGPFEHRRGDVRVDVGRRDRRVADQTGDYEQLLASF